MTKDEYLYALASVKMDGDYCDEKQYSVLQKLIEEHFDNPLLKFEDLHEGGVAMNTDEFKHFKLHSDSTLKSLKKDELISYIHMLYHNWGACDESYYNVMAYANMLDKALDKACKHIEFIINDGKVDADAECPGTLYNFKPQCCNYDFCEGSNSKCWREWFMYLTKYKNQSPVDTGGRR